MTESRPKVLIACNEQVRRNYLLPTELERLERLAEWNWFACEEGGLYEALAQRLDDVEALVLCHGAPRIDAALMERAPRLRFIGELEGDRFAARIDLEAAWKRGIRTIDTTNGSSYPVAEWALGLILICLRNAGAHFRRILAGDTDRHPEAVRLMSGMLHGKRVGLIGGGHMARRLIKLLTPFETEIWVHDPYLPAELAEALGFVRTSLDNVMSACDVVVCLAPLTPATRGMLGKRELDLLRPGSIFVNVSRGAIVDSAALIDRLERNDIVAGIEAFDPEPIPPDSEITRLDNVFLSPHFAWITGPDAPLFFALMVDELERFFHGHEPWFELSPRSQANRRGDPPA